jgi:hypothetical protein
MHESSGKLVEFPREDRVHIRKAVKKNVRESWLKGGKKTCGIIKWL